MLPLWSWYVNCTLLTIVLDKEIQIIPALLSVFKPTVIQQQQLSGHNIVVYFITNHLTYVLHLTKYHQFKNVLNSPISRLKDALTTRKLKRVFLPPPPTLRKYLQQNFKCYHRIHYTGDITATEPCWYQLIGGRQIFLPPQIWCGFVKLCFRFCNF